jgi:hypothetical protein
MFRVETANAFSSPTNISTTLNATLPTCKRSSQALLSSLRAAAWIIYPNTLTQTLLYDVANSSGWSLAQSLCCDDGFYLREAPRQWSIAQSDTGAKAYAAWLRADGTNLHVDVRGWEQEGGWTDESKSYMIIGGTTAQVSGLVFGEVVG